MTTTIHRETATIYQFPVKPRKLFGAQKDMRLTGNLETPRVCIDTHGSWYHEAAIREADMKPKA